MVPAEIQGSPSYTCAKCGAYQGPASPNISQTHSADPTMAGQFAVGSAAMQLPPILYVSIYPAERKEFGGASWVNSRLLSTLRNAGADVAEVCVSPAGAASDERSRGDLVLSVRSDRR